MKTIDVKKQAKIIGGRVNAAQKVITIKKMPRNR